jgi:carbamoyl-phosphate synthase small subunit
MKDARVTSPASSLPHAAADFTPPNGATAVLVLADGSIFWGRGCGAQGIVVGEVCFNTAMTGYQEILTDPSYAGQIITFTFPHVGNVGANLEDHEAAEPVARGLVLREPITLPSNYRSEQTLDAWLERHKLVGISGVDTRRLTRLIREKGAPNGVIQHAQNGVFNVPELLAMAQGWPGLEGMDLAKEVWTRQSYQWARTLWAWGQGFGEQTAPAAHIIAIDYGVKRNILRNLASAGARVTVLPGDATAEDVLAHQPDGLFLSNGPGDPAATGAYAIPTIRTLIENGLPTFGICLGHQLLGLASGARTFKMHQGHRGANHPVKNLETGQVEITVMNHGFAVDPESLPANVKPTHISLFDGTLCGLRFLDRPVFSVQHHPEASPGPQDSFYLFQRFLEMVAQHKKAKAA